MLRIKSAEIAWQLLNAICVAADVSFFLIATCLDAGHGCCVVLYCSISCLYACVLALTANVTGVAPLLSGADRYSASDAAGWRWATQRLAVKLMYVCVLLTSYQPRSVTCKCLLLVFIYVSV